MNFVFFSWYEIWMKKIVWTGSALVQVMACRLFGTKPLPEPMLVYCQLDSREEISGRFKSPASPFIQAQITSQRKLQSSASMAFVQGIHRWPANSPYKEPVTRNMLPFDDVIVPCDYLPMPWQYMQPRNNENHGFNYGWRKTLCLLRRNISTTCTISYLRNDKNALIYF